MLPVGGVEPGQRARQQRALALGHTDILCTAARRLFIAPNPTKFLWRGGFHRFHIIPGLLDSLQEDVLYSTHDFRNPVQIFCLFGVGRSRIHTSERRDKAEHLVEDERYAESVCYEDFEEVDLS
uniref:Uncharacterized protein n=1 Tax=Steinernema glaseri TaxID=37863 RepID=A0A1I7ZQD7_9BILA